MKNDAALGLYLAFRQGLAAALFPELQTAFETYRRDLDWQPIIQARIIGFQKLFPACL